MHRWPSRRAPPTHPPIHPPTHAQTLIALLLRASWQWRHTTRCVRACSGGGGALRSPRLPTLSTPTLRSVGRLAGSAPTLPTSPRAHVLAGLDPYPAQGLRWPMFWLQGRVCAQRKGGWGGGTGGSGCAVACCASPCVACMRARPLGARTHPNARASASTTGRGRHLQAARRRRRHQGPRGRRPVQAGASARACVCEVVGVARIAGLLADAGWGARRRALPPLPPFTSRPRERAHTHARSPRAPQAPTDDNAIAYSRGVSGVLRIVYLGGTSKGGFFPRGMNGAISMAE